MPDAQSAKQTKQEQNFLEKEELHEAILLPCVCTGSSNTNSKYSPAHVYIAYKDPIYSIFKCCGY